MNPRTFWLRLAAFIWWHASHLSQGIWALFPNKSLYGLVLHGSFHNKQLSKYSNVLLNLACTPLIVFSKGCAKAHLITNTLNFNEDIQHGDYLFDAIQSAQSPYNFFTKAFNFGTTYLSWYPIGIRSPSIKSPIGQGFDNYLSLLIGCYNCHTELYKSISDNKDILFPVFAGFHLCEFYTKQVNWILGNVGTFFQICSNIWTFGSLSTWAIFWPKETHFCAMCSSVIFHIKETVYAPLPVGFFGYRAYPLSGF